MIKVEISRQPSDDKQTLGEMNVYEDNKVIYNCKTLELAWKNNEFQVSCIPEKQYVVKKRNSAKYGDHFHVQNVENRDYILIHHGNYNSDILGCILVGQAHTDINKDGYKDVTSSKDTMAKLNEILPAEFEMVIWSD